MSSVLTKEMQDILSNPKRGQAVAHAAAEGRAVRVQVGGKRFVVLSREQLLNAQIHSDAK
jgi:hypothetical protein